LKRNRAKVLDSLLSSITWKSLTQID
jgi:hypothetical protein